MIARFAAGAAGMLLLTAAALTVPGLLSADPGRAGAQAAPARGPLVSWRLGTSVTTARLALDRVAFFSPGSDALRVAPLDASGPGLAALRQTLAEHPARSAAVLYLTDDARLAVFRGDLTVRWRPSASAAHRRRLKKRLGLTLRHLPHRLGTYAVYRAADPLSGLHAVSVLAADDGVAAVVPVLSVPRMVRALPADPLFSYQWNLLDTGQHGAVPGLDIDVAPVWEGTATGTPLMGTHAQVVAVTDDGLQIAHPDLAPNVIPGRSWNWGTGTGDPTPPSSDRHGTAVAGLIAARGYDNGTAGSAPIGITGVAPQAGLIGFRVLVSDYSDDLAESQALLGTTPGGDTRDILDVSSDSWGPEDDRHLEGPGPLAQAALEQGATTGRGGLGTIYVWAAGNGRQADDNVNYDGYANSRFTIAVGACTAQGRVAPYSEPGSPLMVVAPSGGASANDEITTTDLTGVNGYASGDYTQSFSGTSATAPQVAGVVALMLQANPQLTYRDVQAILMRTARTSGLVGSTWQTNAAGHKVSHDFGYGLVDAAAAVKAAATYVSPGPQVELQKTQTVNKAIPDASRTGVTGAIDMSAVSPRLRLEYVDVDLVAPHSYWHDLDVVLISPSGTRSHLSVASPAPDAPADAVGFRNGWRFGSAFDLDESSQGVWRLYVRDRYRHNTGRFVSWTLHLYGSEAPADTTPPVTRVTAPATNWVNGPVTVKLAATDEGSNVAHTEYRLGDSASGPYRVGDRALLQGVSRSRLDDGAHVIWFRSVDNSGNVEEPVRYVVNVDTRRPFTRGGGKIVTRRGGAATFRYTVYDPGFSAHKATVSVRITSAAGKLVKTVDLGSKGTGIALGDSWTCSLAPGTYHYALQAVDPAGNRQSSAAAGTLIVR